MSISNLAGDEFAEGALAARRDEPFSAWTSRPWQEGFTAEKRRQALKALGPIRYEVVHLTLVTLDMVCRFLKGHGPLAVDLAQAIAARSLDGIDTTQEFDPRKFAGVELVEARQ